MKPILWSMLLAAASLACATLSLGQRPQPTAPPLPTAPPPRPTPPAEAPADFAAEYNWQESSLPPPYHYEYTIRVGPGPQGEIVFLPDYPADDTPVWTETFTLAEGDLSGLYRLMVEAGVFTHTWQTVEPPPPGAEIESVDVTAGGAVFSIENELPEADQQAINAVYAAMRDLAPQAIWDKLNAQREEYMQAHPDG